MSEKTRWLVKEVAALTGLTVRTLHHYDEIGLVVPARDANGYRVYVQDDLARLQQVRVYRELELDLDAIKAIVNAPDSDRSITLQRQHAAIEQRIEKLMAIASSVEYAMEAERAGLRLTPREMFEVFGDFDPTAYNDEVAERWSGERLDESRRRTRRYTKADWLRIKSEAAGLNDELAALMKAEVPAAAPEAIAIAEKMRLHIDRWFYPCPAEHHGRLAAMYTEDPRFEATYEKVAPGFAAYVRAAIEANCG